MVPLAKLPVRVPVSLELASAFGGSTVKVQVPPLTLPLSCLTVMLSMPGKSPVAFNRISSGFSMRVHPVFGTWKTHEGVDMAAPLGTPIQASGDGVVDFVGTQNGYGNFVVLKLWSNYSTAYGHMSRFASGLRRGQKVSQGDVIGYVGTTGWATGPHLHYEFRIGGHATDPMALKNLQQQPLSPGEMARFKMAAAEMSRYAPA